jgi:hypothetical protein
VIRLTQRHKRREAQRVEGMLGGIDAGDGGIWVILDKSKVGLGFWLKI